MGNRKADRLSRRSMGNRKADHLSRRSMGNRKVDHLSYKTGRQGSRKSSSLR